MSNQTPETNPALQSDNIAQALDLDPELCQMFIKALGEINPVPKRGRNEALQYPYMMATDVISEVRPPFLKYGILMIPSVVKWQIDNSTGNAYVELRLRFTNTNNGKYFDVFFVGAGNDLTRGGLKDKATSKASTSALKTGLIQTCLIPSGEDSEAARTDEFDEFLGVSKAASPPPPPQPPPAKGDRFYREPPQATRVNGPEAPPAAAEAVTLSDTEVERLVRQSDAIQQREMQRVPVPQPDPQSMWLKDLQHKAEQECQTADEVSALWFDHKDALQKLRIQNQDAFTRIHEAFKARRNELRDPMGGQA